MSGCIEHISVLTQALPDAHSHKHLTFIAWLDLGNAFVPVKHNLLLYFNNLVYLLQCSPHFEKFNLQLLKYLDV